MFRLHQISQMFRMQKLHAVSAIFEIRCGAGKPTYTTGRGKGMVLLAQEARLLFMGDFALFSYQRTKKV